MPITYLPDSMQSLGKSDEENTNNSSNSHSYAIGHDNPDIINIDNATGLQMLDKLSRLNDDRRITPLRQFDNVNYQHRRIDLCNLLIGDTCLMIPPEFIAVTSDSTHQSIVTLRQENTQKIKSGYHKRTVMIDLVFSGIDQLNGYKVKGPEGYYYVDGLRQLLAQFKCTPFLPITNELINGTYGIFTVALQSITIQTMPGFPNVMQAHLTLQEVNMFPYLQMPDASFKYMIDWDLFRFYYQRLLTESHEYKKLQSLPVNKEHNKFKISILDESVFNSEQATRYNLLQIMRDEKIVKTKEDGTTLDDTNYTTWINSEEDNVHISTFQCNYSNILTNIQLSDSGSPTVQFMGGMDTIYNITFETTDYSIVQALEQCQITNDVLTRNNRKFYSLGFVKLDAELVEFTGSKFVMIESVMTNTVPGFPDLYGVQIQCVSYDIAQSEREELNGFLPFDCDKAPCTKYTAEKGFEATHDVHEEQAITQSMEGLLTKIKQDVYAEWKLRSNIEVYPDLRLPTYKEVNEVITKIRKFRTDNGLAQISYSVYPMSPTYMLHGLNLNNSVSFTHSNASKSIIDINSLDKTINQYDLYVDPDFYVFYPTSYESFSKEDEECYSAYNPKQRESFSKIKYSGFYGYTGIHSSNKRLIEEFIAVAESFHGHKYKYGAEGSPDEVDESGELMFDCSGLVTYCLKYVGVMPADAPRFGVADIPNSDLFIGVSSGENQRRDVICSSDIEHIIIYKGKDENGNHKITEAANEDDGVRDHIFWFDSYRVFRPKDFILTEEISPDDVDGKTNDVVINDVSQEIWSILKSYGLTDIAAAGIMGNAYAESSMNPANLQGLYEKGGDNELPGKYTDQSYTAVIDNGSYTIQQFSGDSAGYGLFQFTDGTYKFQLYQMAKYRGVSISNVQLQVDYLISCLQNNGVFDELNSATTIREASDIMLTKYEKPEGMYSETKQSQRAGYSRAYYNKYAGTISMPGIESSEYVLTQGEFNEICRIIMAETQGEGSDAEKAMAQVVYDRLTQPDRSFGGLGNIFNGTPDIFPSAHQGALSDTIEANVKAVFCENNKYWPEYQVLYFLAPGDTHGTVEDYNKAYDKLGDIGNHSFWGAKTQGSDKKFTIVNSYQMGPASKNGFSSHSNITHEAIALDAKKFGQPVFIKTDAIKYSDSWKIWGEGEGEISQKELNSTENIFNSSFCDEVQYSGRGKLVRAFPAYLFCILDDQAQWYNGNKLWTNYYVYKSIVDIAVHSTNDMPTETATITVTNSYHNLDRIQGGLSSYKLSEDEGYNKFQQWWYSWSHTMPGFGPKLTKRLLELHQVICNQALLREGARIHLRMGYGSDPLSLAPVINGHISDISLGDQITIVVTSDGHELIQSMVSTNNKTKDVNAGWLGLFGLGENQESSNIIADIMCKRASWVTHLAGDTFEASKYGIEHFGLYFNKTLFTTATYNNVTSESETYNNEMFDSALQLVANFEDIDSKVIEDVIKKISEETGTEVPELNITTNGTEDNNKDNNTENSNAEDVTESTVSYDDLNFLEKFELNVQAFITTWLIAKGKTSVLSIVSDLLNMITNSNEESESIEDDSSPKITPRVIINSLLALLYIKHKAYSNTWGSVGSDLSDVWDGHQENYDLLKNIYKANYQRQHYIYTTAELVGTKYNEKNIAFNKYNMTPWDVFQMCTQHVPEYILKPTYHQFDSRLYFGLPAWMEKYRYDYLNGTVYEECKSAAQAHFIDSMDCIIENQVKVTSKFSNTNVKVLYTQGSDLKTTDLIHSDDSIDNSKQKTMILDTAIVQDALGPDGLWDFLGYSIGADSARRVGISNLLYGWQQQYQGQLLLMGHPGLKPHDYIMLNDTFANLYGLCIAREVIHSFNINTGFTTSVVPGMVGFSTDENSGLIQVSQNYLMLLNCFSSYTQVRKVLRNNYEKYLSTIAELELLQSSLNIASERLQNFIDSEQKFNNLDSALTATKAAVGATDIFLVIRNLYNMKKAGGIIKNISKAYYEGYKVFKGYNAVKAVVGAGKGIKATLSAIKAGTIAAGTATTGVGGLVMAAIWIVVDILLGEIFEWLSNRNVCTLLPLWWENYPFVAGVKDGEKILLTSSNAVGTDENDQSDGVERTENE